jgi:hypothetical protein
VQQLAARLRTKELMAFFEKVGPVKEAQIVKDRVSGRSKGYVFLLSSPIIRTSANVFSVSAMWNSKAKIPSPAQFNSQARNS